MVQAQLDCLFFIVLSDSTGGSTAEAINTDILYREGTGRIDM